MLDHATVGSLLVVEALPAVIDWHREGLIPLGRELCADARCRFQAGDFFALLQAPGLDAGHPARRFHAILVDIDHSPRHVLHPSHASLYTESGLRRLATHLNPGGVFALWSNDPPDEDFLLLLNAVFERAEGRVVTFYNPLQYRDATNTVYLAR